jgi:Zn finger protein HypA/HybF involved in hydrogenase expression
MNLLFLPERILDKIEPEPNSGCWLWSGRLNHDGYPLLSGRRVHRVIYELLVGPIIKPHLDHKCRTRSCVNPAHLRQATSKENSFALGSLCSAKFYAERHYCHRCGTTLIRRNSKRVERRYRECPRCRSVEQQRYREGHVESIRAEHAAYYIANRDRLALRQKERRARSSRQPRIAASVPG